MPVIFSLNGLTFLLKSHILDVRNRLWYVSCRRKQGLRGFRACKPFRHSEDDFMRKVMVFIDFENFNISLMDYYRGLGEQVARLDYNLLPHKIVEMLPGENELMKTFLCAPKPDDFLMNDSRRKNTYDWINGLKNQKYFTVLEGQHIARPVAGAKMDINDPSSYFVVEKGTDINMAVHMIAKGFLNSYDTAVVVSGDSDYMPVLNILNTIGKITVVVGVQGQNLAKLRKCSDDAIILNKAFFDKCLRT